MTWNTIDFGKYRDTKETIAQIAFNDPNYIRWCLDGGILKGSNLQQAQLASQNLKYLRLPNQLRGTHCVQMLFDYQGKLTDVKVTDIKSLPSITAHNELRSETLNVLYKTDGVGQKLIKKALKDHWLAGKSLTKARLEELLSEPVGSLSIH